MLRNTGQFQHVLLLLLLLLSYDRQGGDKIPKTIGEGMGIQQQHDVMMSRLCRSNNLLVRSIFFVFLLYLTP